MIFTRAAAIFVLPVLASAGTILPRTNPPATTPASQCNTGGLSCCNTTQWRSDGGLGAGIDGILGLFLGPADAFLGLTCSSATLLGLQGGSCSAQPVCCSDNSLRGLVVIGCTPVNVNL